MEEQILDTPVVSVVGFSKKRVWLSLFVNLSMLVFLLCAAYMPFLFVAFWDEDFFFYLCIIYVLVSLFGATTFFHTIYSMNIPMLRKMWKDNIALLLEDDGFLFYGEPRYIRTKILWVDVVKLEIRNVIGTEYVYMEVEKKPYYDETLNWLHKKGINLPRTKNYLVLLFTPIDAYHLKQSIENRMGVKTDV